MAYAFIYFDDEAVEKEWFKNRYQQANQINEENLMKMLNTLKENIYNNLQLKSHRGMYKQAVNDLKLAKKNSSQDLNEINQFKELKEHYKVKWTAFLRHTINIFQFRIRWFCRNGPTKIWLILKAHKKDMLMEKQRIKTTWLIEVIQDSENYNAEILIKEMDKMLSISLRMIKA